MLSRDTTVHLLALLLALTVVLLAAALGVGTEGTEAVLLAVVFYGLALGGAHLYLAVRDEEGLVPVASRWRYVGVLTVVLGAWAIATLAGDVTVGFVELSTLLLVLVAVTIGIYVLLESVAGYRASRP